VYAANIRRMFENNNKCQLLKKIEPKKIVTIRKRWITE
jgi:hypothetical protein